MVCVVTCPLRDCFCPWTGKPCDDCGRDSCRFGHTEAETSNVDDIDDDDDHLDDMINQRARTLVFDFVDAGALEESFERWEENADNGHSGDLVVSSQNDLVANAPLQFDHIKYAFNPVTYEDSGGSSWLGTWASRQRTFDHAGVRQEVDIHNEEDHIGNGEDMKDSPDSSLSSNGKSAESDDVDLQEQAWRYRFARKWQNEQLHGLTNSKSVTEDDEWLQALKCIERGQEPRQIPMENSRTDSIMDRLGSFSMLFSNSSHSLATEACMTPTSATGMGESLQKKVMKKSSSKVNTLLAYQKDIEAEAAKRWNAVRNDWLGNHISSVLIDHWGTYVFVLLKITSYRKRGLHKFILRGRNGEHVYDAMQKIREEILYKAEQKDLELANFDIVGTGEFKWMDQTTLKITCNRVFSDIDEKVSEKDDIVTLAASLLESNGMQSDIKVIT